MARFEYVAWLVRWLLSQSEFEFEWDTGNVFKSIKKHGISVESAEQMFRNKEGLVVLSLSESK